MSGSRRRQMARRTVDQREQRQRQLTVIGVGAAAIVGVLALGLFLFGGAAPGPTPTSGAVGSNRPSGSVRASPSASATAVVVPPTVTASARATSSSSTTIGPSVSLSGPPLTKATARDATFVLMGIDDKVAPEGIPRRITFNVDGAGDVQVDLSDVTAGTVRMCLYQSDGTTDPTDAGCIITDGGNLTRTPNAAGPWTIWLFGDEPGRSPTVTLRIRWASTAAALQLADFRFQGTDSPNYTGFRVQMVPSADGKLELHATWDDGSGGDYPYLAVLTDLDGSGEPPLFQGDGDHADAVRDVSAGNHYEAAIDDTQESVIDQVLLAATVTWP